MKIKIQLDGVLRDYKGAFELCYALYKNNEVTEYNFNPYDNEEILKIFDFTSKHTELIFKDDKDPFSELKEEKPVQVDNYEGYKQFQNNYAFELFTSLNNRKYAKVFDDLNILVKICHDKGHELTLISNEVDHTVGFTMQYLNSNGCRVRKYDFYVKTPKQAWKDCDLLITDNPKFLWNKPFFSLFKKSIKVTTKYNEDVKSDYTIDNLSDLFNLKYFKK